MYAEHRYYIYSTAAICHKSGSPAVQPANSLPPSIFISPLPSRRLPEGSGLWTQPAHPLSNILIQFLQLIARIAAWGRSVFYAPLGLGFRVIGLGLGLAVLFLYRLGLGLGLWSVLRSGEWFGGNIW